MKQVTNVFFLLMFFGYAVAANAAELTETNVKALLEKMDNAVLTLDAGVVASTLSDDVEIIANVNMQGQNHVMKPTKQAYIASLKEAWAMYKNYQYSKSNVVLTMQEDKAVVTATVNESMVVQGRTMSAVSKEIVTVKLVNGQLKITKVVGHTKM